MQRVATAAEAQHHHPRWQNEWNVVDIWLSTHDSDQKITERDETLANTIDTLIPAQPEVHVETNVAENTTDLTEVKLFADGGSRGNPGPSASGFVVLDMADKVLHAEGIFLGITTNNQAEYQALKLGLEHALAEQHARVVHVHMDSMLVVNQMKNIFKVKNRDLWPIHDAIRELLQKFETVTFTHVPREFNKLADAEVNKALDAATGK